MTAPRIPADVAAVLERYPLPVPTRLLHVRDLLFAVAAETDGVGSLTETLKWGEPAYLTEACGIGTTIRLGVSKTKPDAAAVFVNCRTTLIEGFRAQFDAVFDFEGSRALILQVDGAVPEAPLALCLRAALLYRRCAA